MNNSNERPQVMEYIKHLDQLDALPMKCHQWGERL